MALAHPSWPLLQCIPLPSHQCLVFELPFPGCLSLSLAVVLESLLPQAPRSSSLTWLQKWAQHPRNSGFHAGANSHTTSIQKPSLSAACFFSVSLNYSSQDA